MEFASQSLPALPELGFFPLDFCQLVFCCGLRATFGCCLCLFPGLLVTLAVPLRFRDFLLLA